MIKQMYYENRTDRRADIKSHVSEVTAIASNLMS